MSDVPDKSTFASLYSDQAPWDIGKPQKTFIDVADQITGSILDAGCGTGETAFFFASRGQKVTGIDFLAEPITRAKKKAAERGVTATFLVMDALALKDLPEVFDSVIDSGLFHVFKDEDRPKYGSVWLRSNGFSECAAESRFVRLKPVARGATLMRRGRISGAIDRRLRYAVAEVPEALGPVPGRPGNEKAPALTRHQWKVEAAATKDARNPAVNIPGPRHAGPAWLGVQCLNTLGSLFRKRRSNSSYGPLWFSSVIGARRPLTRPRRPWFSFRQRPEVFDPSVAGGPITKGRGGPAAWPVPAVKKWF